MRTLNPARAALRRAPTSAARWAASLLLVALLAPAAVYAQEARTITFDEAIRLALANNNTLERAQNAVAFDATVVDQRYWDFFPNLNFNTNGRQSYGRTFSQEDLNFVQETTESFSFSAGTGINVFNGFQDVARLQQARLNLEASEHLFERTRQTVVFNVLTTFLTLIEQQELIAVREENVTSTQQQLEQIEAFVEVGTRPISDLYQQQAAVASAELQLIETQRLVQNTEAALIQLLQLDPFGNYAFTVPDVENDEVALREYDLVSLLTGAFENRSDLEANAFEIQAARQGIRAARAGWLPSVNLSAGYGTAWNSRFVDRVTGETVPVFDQFDQQRGGSVSLSVSVPIFDRFSTRNTVQQAELQLDNAELALEDLRQDVAVQVRQAVLDYRSAIAGLNAAQAQVQFAEQALEAAQERYDVGAGTLVEVAQQRAVFVQAASDLVQSRYDVVFRQKLIDYYLGVLDPTASLFD